MDRSLLGPVVAEAVGTFLFFAVGIGSIVAPIQAGGTPELVAVALAHGVVLAVLVSVFGHISGGQLNPAVSVALWISGHQGTVRTVAVVAAQLIGAVAAGLAIRGVASVDAVNAAKLGVPVLGPGTSDLQGIAIEGLTTAVLVLAVYGTAIDRRGPKVGGLAIGLALAAGILFGGPLTGGALNPARWFGPAVAGGYFDAWYVWWIGPLAGAAAVALLWRYLFAGEASAGS